MSSLLRPPGSGIAAGKPVTVPQRSPEPAAFTAAVASLRDVDVRPDAVVAEASAPARLAPHAYACTVDLGETATGRLVYLHDPAGQPAWSGRDRLVVFARAQVEAAMAEDPVLTDVVWAWLIDALEGCGAAYDALGGTVTTTGSHRYGSLAHVPPQHEVELRCSWSPLVVAPVRALGSLAGRGESGTLDLAAHLRTLVVTLADMSGLPPDQPGVVGLPTA